MIISWILILNLNSRFGRFILVVIYYYDNYIIGNKKYDTYRMDSIHLRNMRISDRAHSFIHFGDSN